MLGTRAVVRQREPGRWNDCAHCGETIKFQARKHLREVICNIYVGTDWDRIEHWHEECYAEAGEPHGPIIDN